MLSKLFFYIAFFMVFTCGNKIMAQTDNGDEASKMFNMAKERDQKAIDEAVNGWWTESMENHDQRIAWWREARFGMFVHWGIYSLPAGEWKGSKVNGYAEHLMRKEKIPRAEYLDLAQTFNPVEFNADAWIAKAKKAGMHYFIITAKHHDGFAMYPSKVSDFNIHDKTLFTRDPMAELAAACKKYGVKFGFYYSHAFDWEHPDAPGNDWEYQNPGGDLNLFGGTNWYDVHPELLPKAVKYVNEKAIPQIKELIRLYHPDILWFDTPHKLPLSENIRILKEIRATDPNVVINGRLARSSNLRFGDYANTADRPAEFFPVEGDWEAIPTTNESYGYHKFDNSHKPAAFFITLLANAVSRGGNLLMNIGSMGNGAFDPRDLSILDSIGQWMGKNSESIYGNTPSPLPMQSWGVTTMKNNRLYLHVFKWPKDNKLIVGGLKSNVANARFLASDNGKKLKITRTSPMDVCINLDNKMQDPVNTVIELEFTGKLETDTVRVASPDLNIRLLAFDAGLHGKDLRFGDGKAKRYYVDNWFNKEQWLEWQFRTLASASYNVVLKFAGSDDSGGQFTVTADNVPIKGALPVQQQKGEVNTLSLGVLHFKKGVHHLQIKPELLTKPELMKILEIGLIPLK